MKIKLIVEQYEANPNYKPLEDRFHNYDPRPEDQRWLERMCRRLDVEITETEWEAIKKAVLEVM